MSNTMVRAMRMAFTFAFVLCFSASSFAQTVGKISGTVVDRATREPLPAASVRIEGTPMGAMANERGEYFILNVPVGTYDMIVNVIGYAPLRVTGVTVSSDFTTYQDFELESTVLEVAEAVTIVAERPLVEKTLTSSRTIVEVAEIKSLPVVNINEVVLTTAGSFAGTLRGGRSQDQQFTLDGAVATGSVGNTGQAFTVNPYMIQELEVKTGTFNAEYANALSGITSVVTKDGGSSFSGNLEFRTLAQAGLRWASPPPQDLVDAFRAGEINADDLRALINSAINATNNFNNDPARTNDGLALKFPFAALDTSSSNPRDWTARYSRENYYWDYDRINPEPDAGLWSYLSRGLPVAQLNSRGVDRSYTPEKYNGFALHNRTEKRPTQLDWGMGGPVGNRLNWFASGRFSESWGRNPDDYSRLINFFGKMTYRPVSSMKLSFSGLIEDSGFFSGKGQRGVGHGGKYIAEGFNQTFNGKLHFNLNFSHTLSQNTFYEFRFSHLREYNGNWHPKYGKGPLPSGSLAGTITSLGYVPLEESPVGGNTFKVYGDNVYLRGASTLYTDSRPFTTALNFAITSQVSVNHQFKAGAGVTMYDYHESRRGAAQGNAPLIFNDDDFATVGSGNRTPLSGWEYHVYPVEYALFAQDRIEYGGLIVNAGIRLDIFDANANAVNPFRPRPGSSAAFDDPQFRTLTPSIKTGVAPRLGISHPITDRAALHYSYGVFNQRPTLANLYNGLVQSFPFERNHGNPDLPFQTSTNYEMGVQAEVYPGYYLDVTGYFRDVNDLPDGWDIIPEAGFIGGSQRELTVLYPTFAQDARGFEVSARRQLANRFSVRANYTVSFTTNLGRAPGERAGSITSFNELVEGTPILDTYTRSFAGTDRRHRIVGNLLIQLPYDVTTSWLLQANSGNEFRTKNEAVVDPLGLLGKARRSPWTWTLDLYAQKTVDLGGARVGVFTDIRNITNRRNLWSVGGSLNAAERFVRRGDPVGFLGGPIGGIGTIASRPRDVFVGFNVTW